jgi:hypothetical protein
MSYRDCKGYTEYTATCSECDFEESVDSISMHCAHAKLSVEDGDNCPEEGCIGKITIEEREVSESEHKEGYLDYHADDDHDRDR